MPKQTINVGTAPNDGTGDDLRTAGEKFNAMFDELYAAIADLEVQVVDTPEDYVAIEPKNPKKLYLVKDA